MSAFRYVIAAALVVGTGLLIYGLTQFQFQTGNHSANQITAGAMLIVAAWSAVYLK